MTACFSEYSRKVLDKAKSRQPTIPEQMKQAEQQLAKEKPPKEHMEGIKVKDTAKRAIVTVIVFVIIYVLSGPIIGYTNYDMYLKGIEFLSAVIGAGCYWIGSNKK